MLDTIEHMSDHSVEDEKELKTLLSNQITSKHQHVVKDFSSRMNALSYYLNEEESDAKEFRWTAKRNMSKETQNNLLPIVLCEVLSYNISSLETRFRSYSRQEISDKLPRALQLNNTVISNLWRMFHLHCLQQKFTTLSAKGHGRFFKWANLFNFFKSCFYFLFYAKGEWRREEGGKQLIVC
ncbi:hypothetical protein RFI_10075 [Reticulomyxa filosa]|uniref:Uncharacterized protein n=1 Tax=Reticulomyxa filosa TaxID=46433 RepID=X6NMY1_RETFI|nr:hypothetical protein RFI_10075 [Reticulomyxa filosa]|eukprot:ETO27054.1 hypothetical protein RFI_10075 [Reticulomyxa filosa]